MKKKDLKCCGNCKHFSSYDYTNEPFCKIDMTQPLPSEWCNSWDFDKKTQEERNNF